MGFAGVCDPTAAFESPPHDPLNIVLFLVDDLGWQDLSVPMHDEATPLNARYRTPAAERLAAEGMRFSNAYASAPVCTPTRTSIMTGMCPARSGVTYWTLHRDRDTSAKHPSLDPPPWRMNGLDEQDVTLPSLLRRAGYRTIHVGKAHFGAHESFAADPTRIGFDINVAGHASGGPASYYGTHHFTVAGRQGKDPSSSSSVWDIPGLESYHGQDIYLTEALATEAAQAIRNAVSDGQPFFLNFAPYAVHAPIMANHQYLGEYAELDDREAAYATMIETVDAALATLIDTLEEVEALDRTIIIYSSDNGGLSAHARGAAPDGQTRHTHNAPLRSGKGSAYEGGVRVPLIVRWPNAVPRPSVSHAPVVSHDFFPTILAMSGVPVPKAHEPSVDGIDLTPLLRGESHDEFLDRSILFHQPHQWGASGPGIEPFTSIRHGSWKLIYFHEGPRFELYDLSSDVGESQNVAAERPALVRDLADRMTEWIDETNAQLSIDRVSGAPIGRPDAAARRQFP